MLASYVIMLGRSQTPSSPHGHYERFFAGAMLEIYFFKHSK